MIWKIQNFFQKLFWGFNDYEIADLDIELTKFLLPRIKRFRKVYKSFINRDKEYKEDIDKIIEALELMKKDDVSTDEEDKKIEEGLKAFVKRYRGLWY